MIMLSSLSMHPSWQLLLKEEFQKPYIKELENFLNSDAGLFYPPVDKIFQALKLTPFDEVKVVIIGQDPYHGQGQAEGLAFSVPENIKLPPSLKNIFKELKNDLGIEIPKNGSLENWAKQGVLLLNATLTVKKDMAKSHYGMGWEVFTNTIVKMLAKKTTPLVFLLWGNSAIEKVQSIVSLSSIHGIFSSPHPSPLSAYNGFFGSKPFSKANDFLIQHNQKPINWSL